MFTCGIYLFCKHAKHLQDIFVLICNRNENNKWGVAYGFC